MLSLKLVYIDIRFSSHLPFYLQDDRPVYPYKIVKTEVLNNPFPDIEPRVKIENEIPKEKRSKKHKGTK